jgi:hypothetical protein
MSPKQMVSFSSGSESIFLATVAYNGAEYVSDLSLHSLGYIFSPSDPAADSLPCDKLINPLF